MAAADAEGRPVCWRCTRFVPVDDTGFPLTPNQEQLDEFRKLFRQADAAGPDSPLWTEVDAMANRIGLGYTGFDPDDE